jgi:hypothetical protein
MHALSNEVELSQNVTSEGSGDIRVSLDSSSAVSADHRMKKVNGDCETR